MVERVLDVYEVIGSSPIPPTKQQYEETEKINHQEEGK